MPRNGEIRLEIENGTITKIQRFIEELDGWANTPPHDWGIALERWYVQELHTVREGVDAPFRYTIEHTILAGRLPVEELQQEAIEERFQPFPDEQPQPRPPNKAKRMIRIAAKTPITERSTRLPRYKMKYETAEEANFRLHDSIITVRDQALYILSAQEDATGRIIVTTHDQDGVNDMYFLDEPGLDLRSADPGYVNFGNRVIHMVRRPARVYKQGLTKDNCYGRDVGRREYASLVNQLPVRLILQGLNSRSVNTFSEEQTSLLLEGRIPADAIRLSDNVAIYLRGNNYRNRLAIEYKGRKLGALVKDRVKLISDSDLECPWLIEDLEQVGLRLK